MKKNCKNNIIKRITSAILSLSIFVSLVIFGTSSAAAFDKSYISNEGMAIGYAIANGYSKMYYRTTEQTSGKIAVYCGLDVTNPYLLTMGGMYILSKDIDIDRLLSDNSYGMDNISKFNSYLSKIGIKNERAKAFKDSISSDNIKFETSFDTVGIYIFEADTEYALNLMNNNPYVDFIVANGKIPNMKDLNFDGVTDEKDAVLIQQYLVGDFETLDSDEAEYAQFASDINKDKKIDVCDVTAIAKGAF